MRFQPVFNGQRSVFVEFFFGVFIKKLFTHEPRQIALRSSEPRFRHDPPPTAKLFQQFSSPDRHDSEPSRAVTSCLRRSLDPKILKLWNKRLCEILVRRPIFGTQTTGPTPFRRWSRASRR